MRILVDLRRLNLLIRHGLDEDNFQIASMRDASACMGAPTDGPPSRIGAAGCALGGRHVRLKSEESLTRQNQIH